MAEGERKESQRGERKESEEKDSGEKGEDCFISERKKMEGKGLRKVRTYGKDEERERKEGRKTGKG